MATFSSLHSGLVGATGANRKLRLASEEPMTPSVTSKLDLPSKYIVIALEVLSTLVGLSPTSP